jgi:hypothetical protein
MFYIVKISSLSFTYFRRSVQYSVCRMLALTNFLSLICKIRVVKKSTCLLLRCILVSYSKNFSKFIMFQRKLNIWVCLIRLNVHNGVLLKHSKDN